MRLMQTALCALLPGVLCQLAEACCTPADAPAVLRRLGPAATAILADPEPQPGGGAQTNIVFGLGIETELGSHWAFRFQYQRLGNARVGPIVSSGGTLAGTGGDPGMIAVSGGLVYRF